MSGDLRAAVEAARTAGDGETDFAKGWDAALGYVLDLIPKDGVWVTEETLARAFQRERWQAGWHSRRAIPQAMQDEAAAIMRHLREGT